MQPLIQNVILRVEGDTIQPHFVVQVGPRSPPRITDSGNSLTSFDSLTHLGI